MIAQEVITPVVLVPFSVLCMKEPVKLGYLWAAACLVGAVFSVIRSNMA